MDPDARKLLAPSPPLVALPALLLRVAAGTLLIGFGLSKFTNHTAEAVSFGRFGLPAPDAFTYAIGTVEVAGGALLVLGLATRLVAVGSPATWSARSRPAGAWTAAS